MEFPVSWRSILDVWADLKYGKLPAPRDPVWARLLPDYWSWTFDWSVFQEEINDAVGRFFARTHEYRQSASENVRQDRRNSRGRLPKVTELVKQHVADLYEAGLTVSQISVHLSLSFPTVRDIVSQNEAARGGPWRPIRR